ncbi:hypothetical protein [Robbsia sp. KACC 23696]|uniref:hypothetical protein n=1 Tax=Robbsia sp. KACC 23696 TaxID=3149231 RepID=UPI00325BEC7F
MDRRDLALMVCLAKFLARHHGGLFDDLEGPTFLVQHRAVDGLQPDIAHQHDDFANRAGEMPIGLDLQRL